MYYVYILYSTGSDAYYVGYSSDFNRRFEEHNHSLHTTYTSKHRPWELKAVYSCGDDEKVAINIERFIKRQKNAGFLFNTFWARSLPRCISGSSASGAN